jgi:predicted MFS family arabinose efflux permease
VVVLVTLFESTFFAALAPLLPHLKDELDFSKSAAGLLTAAYAIGVAIIAVPGGLLGARVGPKKVALTGIVVISLGSVGFGFAESYWQLVLARGGQGLGAGLAWTSAFSWLVHAAPRERRGELIAVAVIAVATVTAASRVPGPIPTDRQGLSDLWRGIRHPRVAGGLALVSLPAFCVGVLFVLGPLALDHAGLGPVGITVTFICASATLGVASPFVGKRIDRYGRRGLVTLALICATALALALPWAHSRWALAPAAVAFEVFWIPGTSLLSEGIERAGVHQSLGFSLMNLAIGPGFIVGSAAGGALAAVTGDRVPYLIVAALTGTALLAVRRLRLRDTALPAALDHG